MAKKEEKQGKNMKREERQGDQNQGQQAGKTSGMPSVSAQGAGGQMSLYEPLRQLREEIDRMFDRWWGSWPSLQHFGGRSLFGQAGQAGNDWGGLDIEETDDEIVVRADAPGFEPDEFDLQVRGNQLLLRGKHREEAKENGGRAWSEREICRTATLPAEVDVEGVDAQYRNGVLTVTLPKTTPTVSHRIEVNG